MPSRSERENVRHLRHIKADALRRADREQRRRDAAAERQRLRAEKQKTRGRVKGALGTLRRLARLARHRLVERQRAERARVLAALRARFLEERAELRRRIRERRLAIQVLGLSQLERRRQLRVARREAAAELRAHRKAEKEARRELLQAERGRRLAEAKAENDEETLTEIESQHPEWSKLWHKVKDNIRARPGMSRAEAFFHYAEENPSEVYAGADEGLDQWIREQESELYRQHGIERRPKRAKQAARVARAAPKPGRPWFERVTLDRKHYARGLVRLVHEELERADRLMAQGEHPQWWGTVAAWLRGDPTRRITFTTTGRDGEVMRAQQKHRGRIIHVDRRCLASAPEHFARVAYRFVHLEIEDSSDPSTQFVRVWEREQGAAAPPF